MSKVHYVILRDAIEYKFDPSEFTAKEARKKALGLWSERRPQVYVFENEEEDTDGLFIVGN